MSKRFVFTLYISLFYTTFVFSQNHSRADYILKYQSLAIREMCRSGIPASITMAQACLESGDGNGELAKKSNNHFGIKCKNDWNGKKVLHDDDQRDECFRKYRHVEDSYIDHTNFLMQSSRYAFLFNYPTNDYKSWAKGLKKAGYATASDYDKRLIDIIESNKLYQLDDKYSANELTLYKQQIVTRQEPEGILINPYHTRRVEVRNGLKSVVVRNGDTFETIAQEFGLKDWEIYRFNDCLEGYSLRPFEIVYIQPKKRQAQKHLYTHTVHEGESLHLISQMYGVRMKSLYHMNKIKPGQRLVVGQKLNLRKKMKY